MTESRKGRERDAEVARETILAAATEIFACSGFDGARIDAIAAASGYNKSLIFHYFGDKLGIFRAVMCRMKEQSEHELVRVMAQTLLDEDAAADPGKVRRFIEETTRWYFDHLASRPQLLRILGWEAANEWRTFMSMLPERDALAHYAGPLDAFTRRARQAGILRADLDPPVLLVSVLGLTLMYHLSLARLQTLAPTRDLGCAAERERACEQIVQLVLHGTLTHPGQHLSEHQSKDQLEHQREHRLFAGTEETDHAAGL